MRNPEEFAEKVNRVPQSLAFRENPTGRGMRNYILDNVTKKRRVIPRSISVWDDNQDDDEDGGGHSRPGRRRAQGGSRGRQSAPARAQQQQQEDDWESSPTPRGRSQSQPRPHQRARGRKTSPRPPSDPDSDSDSDSGIKVYTQKDPLPTKRRRQLVPAPSTSTPKSSSSSSDEEDPPANEKTKANPTAKPPQSRACNTAKVCPKDVVLESTSAVNKGKAPAKKNEAVAVSNLAKDNAKGKSLKEQKKCHPQADSARAQERGQPSTDKPNVQGRSSRTGKRKESQEDDNPWAGFPTYPSKRNKK